MGWDKIIVQCPHTGNGQVAIPRFILLHRNIIKLDQLEY